MFLTPLQRARRAAFTLIELLVVIAIIIILIALLFPALNGARERMNVALCLHNMQQLATAGFSYAVDHDGNLPRNNSGGQSGDWIVGFDPTGQSGLDSIHNGTLWPYTKEEKIYKCPSYPYHNLYKRTYSMADYVTGDGGQANVPDASRQPPDSWRP